MTRRLNDDEDGLVGYWNFDDGQITDGTGKSGVGELINEGILETDETNAWRIAQDGNKILIHTDEVFPMTPCVIQTSAEIVPDNWTDSPMKRSLAVERIPFIFTNAPSGHTYYRGRILKNSVQNNLHAPQPPSFPSQASAVVSVSRKSVRLSASIPQNSRTIIGRYYRYVKASGRKKIRIIAYFINRRIRIYYEALILRYMSASN